MFLKLCASAVFIYLFFNPEIFAMRGYALAIDGTVVCRGISLILGIYIFLESLAIPFKEEFKDEEDKTGDK